MNAVRTPIFPYRVVQFLIFFEALVTLTTLIYATEVRKAIHSVSPAKVTFGIPTVILASKREDSHIRTSSFNQHHLCG
jgi:hypothetical protein